LYTSQITETNGLIIEQNNIREWLNECSLVISASFSKWYKIHDQ